jgi:hypothetical protein
VIGGREPPYTSLVTAIPIKPVNLMRLKTEAMIYYFGFSNIRSFSDVGLMDEDIPAFHKKISTSKKTRNHFRRLNYANANHPGVLCSLTLYRPCR